MAFKLSPNQWYVCDGDYRAADDTSITATEPDGRDCWALFPVLFYRIREKGKGELYLDAGVNIHVCTNGLDFGSAGVDTMQVPGAVPPSITCSGYGHDYPYIKPDYMAYLPLWPNRVSGEADGSDTVSSAIVAGGYLYSHTYSANNTTLAQGATANFDEDVDVYYKTFVLPYSQATSGLVISWRHAFARVMNYRISRWPPGKYFTINYPVFDIELPDVSPPYTAISGGDIQIKSFTATSATTGKFVVWYGDFVGGEGNPVASTKLEVSKNGGAFVNCNKNSPGTHEYSVSGISEGDQFVFRATATNTITTEGFENRVVSTSAWVITIPAPAPVTGLGYKSRITSVESSPVGDYKTSSGEFKSISVLNGLCVYWSSSALATSYDVSMQIATPSSTVPTSATSSGLGRNVTGTEADMGPRDVSVWHTFVYPGCWVRFGVTAKRGTKASSAVYGEWVRVRGYARIRNRGKFQVTRPYVNVDGANKNVAHIMVYKNGEWTESY